MMMENPFELPQIKLPNLSADSDVPQGTEAHISKLMICVLVLVTFGFTVVKLNELLDWMFDCFNRPKKSVKDWWATIGLALLIALACFLAYFRTNYLLLWLFSGKLFHYWNKNEGSSESTESTESMESLDYDQITKRVAEIIQTVQEQSQILADSKRKLKNMERAMKKLDVINAQACG